MENITQSNGTKNFADRRAVRLSSLSILFILIIIVLLGIITVNSNHKLNIIMEEQQDLLESQHEVYSSLLVFNNNRTWKELKIATDTVSEDYEQNKERIDDNTEKIKSMYQINLFFISAAAVVLLSHITMIYFLVIKKILPVPVVIFGDSSLQSKAG